MNSRSARSGDDAVRTASYGRMNSPSSWWIERRGRLHRRVLEAGRLRHGVGVERGLEHRPAARPEAVADHLVRVRVAHERRPFARRRGPAREARDGQVEAAPEEVHRAALADEAAARRGEHALDLHEDRQKRCACSASYGGVLRVLARSGSATESPPASARSSPSSRRSRRSPSPRGRSRRPIAAPARTVRVVAIRGHG